jgi:hypothetical protein
MNRSLSGWHSKLAKIYPALRVLMITGISELYVPGPALSLCRPYPDGFLRICAISCSCGETPK